MQKRHSNRQVYFNESANTSRDFYIDYLKRFVFIGQGVHVLEIGCGEGGNLLPFAETGCNVTGIDLSGDRIQQAKDFFLPLNYDSTFFAGDFFDMETPGDNGGRYDIILIHDVIEHIPEKELFMNRIKQFIAKDGIVFWGFPAWQMPFGGHQQICRSKICSSLPFIHLLPAALYRAALKMFGEKEACIDTLLDIKNCRMSIESFEKLLKRNGLSCIDRCLWLINPHYKQKFNLKPRKLYHFISHITFVRNFFCTACFYLTKCEE